MLSFGSAGYSVKSGLKVSAQGRCGVILPEYTETLQFRHDAVHEFSKGIRQEGRRDNESSDVAGGENIRKLVGDLLWRTAKLRHQHALAVLPSDLTQAERIVLCNPRRHRNQALGS